MTLGSTFVGICDDLGDLNVVELQNITDTFYINNIIMSSGLLLVVSFLAMGVGCAFQPSSNFSVNQRSTTSLEMGFGNEYIPSGFTKAR